MEGVMSVNTSSSSNASLSPSPSSHSSISMYSFLTICFQCKAVVFNITAFTIFSISILLPLCIYILYQCLQQWQQQRSGATTSHSSVFTYHMTIIEMMNMCGTMLICCSIHTELPVMMTVGLLLNSINLSGQTLFHMLTCVERYLAVVHPVTYLRLKRAKGIRIRNVTIGCVWLLSSLSLGFIFMESQVLPAIVSMGAISFVLIAVSFCSLSVLHVLIRPGPGEGGGGRQLVDQSKLRAFYTIMFILGVLVLRLVMYLFIISTYALSTLSHVVKCIVWTSIVWVNLPSSLVLPLLFLQRAGKLLCCKNNNESGQGAG